MSFVDYYAVLGVSTTSEAVVIKAAYKALMRKYHPDTSQSSDAAEKAQAINAAYAILGDPEKRAAYDRQREEHAASTSRTDTSASNPQRPTPPPPSKSSQAASPSPSPPSPTDKSPVRESFSALLVAGIMLPISILAAVQLISMNQEENDASDTSHLQSDDYEMEAMEAGARAAAEGADAAAAGAEYDGALMRPQNILIQENGYYPYQDTEEGINYNFNEWDRGAESRAAEAAAKAKAAVEAAREAVESFKEVEKNDPDDDKFITEYR